MIGGILCILKIQQIRHERQFRLPIYQSKQKSKAKSIQQPFNKTDTRKPSYNTTSSNLTLRQPVYKTKSVAKSPNITLVRQPSRKEGELPKPSAPIRGDSLV